MSTNTFWIVFAMLSGSFWTWLLMTRRAAQRAKAAAPSPAATAPPPVEEKKHPCTPWHLFEVISTRHVQLACPHTSVLSRCKVCGQHKTEVFPGDFDLRDFVMAKNELERLEGMFH